MGAFGRKSSSDVPDPQNSAFATETRVLQLFRAERIEMLQNTPKHRFGSNVGYWERSSKKTRRRFRTPETRVLQLFRGERTEMLQKTPKHHFGSNGGYWVRSGKKARRRFRTPEPVHLAPKHEFCNFFVPNVPKNSKTLPIIILVLM